MTLPVFPIFLILRDFLVEEFARLDKGHSDAVSTVVLLIVVIIGAFAEDLEARTFFLFMDALDDVLVGI